MALAVRREDSGAAWRRMDGDPLVSTVELVDAADIRPSAYNPREAKPERLELVRLSLSKLGWLLPIYVDADGEILSGHQRHHVAVEMLGATKVPVVRTRAMKLKERQALNMVFNRATNDLEHAQNSEQLTMDLLTSRIPERAAELPDLEVDADEWYPILRTETVDPVELLDANPLWTDMHGLVMSRHMVRMGGVAVMPIVATPSNRVVNGRARLALAGASELDSVEVVRVPEGVADVAEGLLNLLSMRYSVESTLADELRSNAFGATMISRRVMSTATVLDLFDDVQVLDFQNPEHQKAWRGHYGDLVVDFGSGRQFDTTKMRAMGVEVHSFEPFFFRDLERARELNTTFLHAIAEGRRYDTLFLCSVMNSIPFHDDRVKVIRILAALGYPDSQLHATGRSSLQSAISDLSGAGSKASDSNGILVDYEPRVRIGQIGGGRPVVQRFHTLDEFDQEFREGGWGRVRTRMGPSTPFAVCSRPLEPDPVLLAEAIDFEFDLPWSGDRSVTLGLADLARQAFAERLSMPELLSVGRDEPLDPYVRPGS